MSMVFNALSGAAAAQAALNAVSQNIANTNTQGYSRQGVVLATRIPAPGDPHSAGAGVDVAAIRRFSDDYKNLQLWNAASSRGEVSVLRQYYGQLEQVMGNSGSSLSVGLDKFYAALNAVTADVGSAPLRSQVLSEAEALGNRVNSLNRVFATQQSSVNEQRAATLRQINTLSSNIAALNYSISAADAAGENVSGLLDERDRSIDQLAELVDIRVSDQAHGSKTVTLREGPPLVVGNTAAQLSSETRPDGSQRVTLAFANENFVLGRDNLGGQLGGLNHYEQKVLQPMMAAVKDLASELSSRINSQLKLGFDLNGQPGAALFVFDAANPDRMLQLSTIQASQLGFSADAAKPGNSQNLIAVMAVKDQQAPIGQLGNVTLNDAYAQLTGQLAIASQQNKAAISTADIVRAEAEKSWKATSGVNNDEEAVNLIEFQKMYQANMKVIAIANELFDSTLAMM